MATIGDWQLPIVRLTPDTGNGGDPNNSDGDGSHQQA